MPGAERFVQRDAAFRQRECLVVVVADQRDVGLVVHDAGEDIVGLDRGREPLALAQGGGGVIGPSGLREQDGRQPVHERKVPAVAGGMQGR